MKTQEELDREAADEHCRKMGWDTYPAIATEAFLSGIAHARATPHDDEERKANERLEIEWPLVQKNLALQASLDKLTSERDELAEKLRWAEDFIAFTPCDTHQFEMAGKVIESTHSKGCRKCEALTKLRAAGEGEGGE